MRRLLIALFTVLLLVSCSNEPEIDYKEKAIEARTVFLVKGIIVGSPSIDGETVRFSITLLNQENEYLLEGKAVRNPILKISWSITTTVNEVYRGKVPQDEEKRKDMGVVWIYNYLMIEEA